MNKVRFVANKDTNYVFHMLSVAKCGYDNTYGSYYRNLYPAEDLAVIKENEPLLSVCGGEHCGFLYGTLVSEIIIPSLIQSRGIIKKCALAV